MSETHLRRHDVAIAFATFEAAGCRAPKSHGTDEGLDFALRVWLSVLSDVTRQELLELVIAYVRSPGSKWWPTPGELLTLRKDSSDDALEAWGRMFKAIGRFGRARPPTPRAQLPLSTVVEVPIWCLDDDPDVDRAMHAGLAAIGGWRVACQIKESDQIAHRAAFRDAYRSARGRAAWAGERAAVAAITGGKLPPMLTDGIAND